MDQMEQKLGAILSDPASMSKIMELARGLGLNPQSAQPESAPGQSAQAQTYPSPAQAQPAPAAQASFATSASGQPQGNPFAAQGLGGNPIGTLLSAMGNQGGDDKQTLLLKALRPYLRAERQERLDRAIQTARMVRIAKQAMKQFKQ